jgi:hypothetical protein
LALRAVVVILMMKWFLLILYSILLSSVDLISRIYKYLKLPLNLWLLLLLHHLQGLKA